MEATNRLKIKIGPHEFEAEGPPEIVQEQFRAFKEMVATVPLPTTPAHQEKTPFETIKLLSGGTDAPEPNDAEHALHKILDTENSTVSLTVRPATVEDAVLLILLGHKWLMGNESVTGGMVMGGITKTGGLPVNRVDRLLEKLGREGNVIVIGEHRSKRYRLTNAGVNRAKQIGDEMLAIVS